ncbi:MAG: hypothetical protein JW727_06380 [Candidatus Aenigmarchaeota archaeon]|nr:hypothetical protein [Candidatus Aenigmarchaeota archaeon]
MRAELKPVDLKPGYLEWVGLRQPLELAEIDYGVARELAGELNAQMTGNKYHVYFLPSKGIFDPWDSGWKGFRQPLEVTGVD